jgi:heme A synthase
MSFVSNLWAKVVHAARNPAQLRKEAVATATSVLSDIAIFSTILTHVPAPVAVGVAGVKAAAVFVLTVLGGPVPPATGLGAASPTP